MYIDENITYPITLEEVAAAASMSRTYFFAVFKKINGITPWKYITVKRVEKAVELIKTTDMTKLDIAFSCGFSSSSNFYKAFKSVILHKLGAVILKISNKRRIVYRLGA